MRTRQSNGATFDLRQEERKSCRTGFAVIYNSGIKSTVLKSHSFIRKRPFVACLFEQTPFLFKV